MRGTLFELLAAFALTLSEREAATVPIRSLYADPRFLDVAAALDVLPALPLGTLAAATGT